MVILRYKRCAHCSSKMPSYGVDGSNKTEFCSTQRGTGWMVDFKNRRLHNGYTKLLLTVKMAARSRSSVSSTRGAGWST